MQTPEKTFTEPVDHLLERGEDFEVGPEHLGELDGLVRKLESELRAEGFKIDYATEGTQPRQWFVYLTKESDEHVEIEVWHMADGRRVAREIKEDSYGPVPGETDLNIIDEETWRKINVLCKAFNLREGISDSVPYKL